jgi:hypothetical protein
MPLSEHKTEFTAAKTLTGGSKINKKGASSRTMKYMYILFRTREKRTPPPHFPMAAGVYFLRWLHACIKSASKEIYLFSCRNKLDNEKYTESW